MLYNCCPICIQLKECSQEERAKDSKCETEIHQRI